MKKWIKSIYLLMICMSLQGMDFKESTFVESEMELAPSWQDFDSEPIIDTLDLTPIADIENADLEQSTIQALEEQKMALEAQLNLVLDEKQKDILEKKIKVLERMIQGGDDFDLKNKVLDEKRKDFFRELLLKKAREIKDQKINYQNQFDSHEDNTQLLPAMQSFMRHDHIIQECLHQRALGNLDFVISQRDLTQHDLNLTGHLMTPANNASQMRLRVLDGMVLGRHDLSENPTLTPLSNNQYFSAISDNPTQPSSTSRPSYRDVVERGRSAVSTTRQQSQNRSQTHPTALKVYNNRNGSYITINGKHIPVSEGKVLRVDGIDCVVIDGQIGALDQGATIVDASGKCHVGIGSNRIITLDNRANVAPWPDGSATFFKNNEVYTIPLNTCTFSADKKEVYLRLADNVHIIQKNDAYKDPATGIHYVHLNDEVCEVLPGGKGLAHEGLTYFEFEGKLGRLANHDCLDSHATNTRYQNVDGVIVKTPLEQKDFSLAPQNPVVQIDDTVGSAREVALSTAERLSQTTDLLGTSAPPAPSISQEVDTRIEAALSALGDYKDFDTHMEVVGAVLNDLKTQGLLDSSNDTMVRDAITHGLKHFINEFNPSSIAEQPGEFALNGAKCVGIALFHVATEGMFIGTEKAVLLATELHGLAEMVTRDHSELTLEQRAELIAEKVADFIKIAVADKAVRRGFPNLKNSVQFKPSQARKVDPLEGKAPIEGSVPEGVTPEGVRFKISEAMEQPGVLKSTTDKMASGSAKNISNKITVEDLTKIATPGEKTLGRSKLYELQGGFKQALKDFELLQPKSVKDISDMTGVKKVGILEDGRTVIIRETSKGLQNNGPPTLEIQQGKNKIKLRYR